MQEPSPLGVPPDFQTPVAHAPPTQPGAPPVLPQGPDGLAVASFVLGILCCIACCSPLISISLGVVGLVLGLVSKTRGGFRKAGVVMCIVGPCVSLLWIILLVLGVVAVPFLAGKGP